MIYAETVIEAIAALGSLASSAYYLLVLWSARSYLKNRDAEYSAAKDHPGFLPPVSILKPLKGVDPEIYESFRSHCLQNYPHYEIIFGVSEPDDPALHSVLRLQEEFPDAAIRLVICDRKLGGNMKVSNLVQMLSSARYEHLIVNDSDIRVESDYLRRVMAPLLDPQVGMVTCLYCGIAAPRLGSQFEALGISTDFSPGVLAARVIEGGIKFGLGSTLAFRRRDLDAIGGLESLVDYLADDYELGKRLSDRGLKICLSGVVVETFLPAYGFRGFFDHQLRWGRGMRASRTGGYAGLLFTFGLPWAALALIASRGALWAWALAAFVVVLRALTAWMVGGCVLRDRQLRALWYLVPLRDFVAVLVWLGSFTGNHITWRGDRFSLEKGKLVRIDS